MNLRAGALAIWLLAGCATAPSPRPEPLVPRPPLVGARIQLASAAVSPTVHRALVRRADLDLARELLLQARGAIEPGHWDLLDRKLEAAEQAWERYEAVARSHGKAPEIERTDPAIGLVGTLGYGTQLAAEASSTAMLATLAGLWPGSVANGALPPWADAEREATDRLRELAQAARKVRAELPAGKARQERRGYVVRLQAQGEGLEQSVVLAKPVPITKAEGITGLEVLKGKLSKNELRVREESFRRAERFIRSIVGGIGPGSKRSFDARGSKARVDIEILAGLNFEK